jgi:hypothetical protein
MYKLPASLPAQTSTYTNYQLPESELNKMQMRLKENLMYLNTNRYILSPDNYHQLINYHQYSLNLLNSLQQAQTPDGTKNIYQGMQFPNKKSPWDSNNNPWEEQFDETVKNPALFNLPSNNVWASPPWK